MPLPTRLMNFVLNQDFQIGMLSAPTLQLELSIDEETANQIAKLHGGQILEWPELEALLMSEDDKDRFLQQLVKERAESRRTIAGMLRTSIMKDAQIAELKTLVERNANAANPLAELKAALRKAVA